MLVFGALLLLGIGHALGVHAQGGGTLIAGAMLGPVEYAVTPSGQIYNRIHHPDSFEPWTPATTISVPSPVVALSVTSDSPPNPIYVVYCQDGTVIECNQAGQCSTSNVFSGPTPATTETWGQVKARYR